MWRAIPFLFLAAATHAEVVVIGNSITRHPPNAAVGWSMDHGMAASRPERDFAHLVAGQLQVPLRLVNLSAMERGEPADDNVIGGASVVVVELGDNVKPEALAAFVPRYRALLARARGKRLVCLSTFWQHLRKDAEIFDACTAAGGAYVYIGDLYTDRRNTDRARQDFPNPDVDAHPKDWAMQRIADRIVKAAR